MTPQTDTESIRKLHYQAIMIDGHNDNAVLKGSRGLPFNFTERDPKYHTDLQRMQEGGLDIQFLVVGDGDNADALSVIEKVYAEVEAHPDVLTVVKNVAEIKQAKSKGQVGLLMCFEDAKWLKGDVDILRLYYRLGIRSLGLTHGQGGDEPHHIQEDRSFFGYRELKDKEEERRTKKGLTGFGRQLVIEMNQLGVQVDLAHINEAAFFDVLEISTKPVVTTHGNVFSLCPHSRNLTDDQIKALAATGGMMGIAFVPGFVDQSNPTLEKLLDHIGYVADLVGIDYVGIGSDYDGMSDTPVIPEVSQLPRLTEGMVKRGMSDEEIAKVLGGNFLRVLEATIG
jgi:membrane dipeptidase